jgi:hypothetical protein
MREVTNFTEGAMVVRRTDRFDIEATKARLGQFTMLLGLAHRPPAQPARYGTVTAAYFATQCRTLLRTTTTLDICRNLEQNENSIGVLIVTSEKFIVLQFKKNRGQIVPGEMRQASNAVSAEKIAAAMASRVIGVAAYSVMVDEETGDMASPRLIAQHGETADLAA